MKKLHGENIVFQPNKSTLFRLTVFGLLGWLYARYAKNMKSPIPFIVFGLLREARCRVCHYYKIHVGLFERDMENRRKYLSVLLHRNMAHYPERLPPSVSAKWFEEAES